MEWKAGLGRDVIKLFFFVNGAIENRIEWLPQASLFGNAFLSRPKAFKIQHTHKLQG